MNLDEKKQLYSLLNALREEVLTDEQFTELENLVLSDSEAAQEYVLYVNLWTDLQFFRAASETSSMGSTADLESYIDSDFWREMANYEKSAPGIENPEEKLQRDLIQKVVHPQLEKRKVSKFSMFTLVMSIAAILFVLAFPKIFPPKSNSVEVATLVDQVGVQWGHSKSSETLEVGSRLRSQTAPLWLKKGTVKVEFDYGAEVIIQGPAEFELVDEEKMVLNSGRLYVTIRDGSAGFTTVTPSATIFDLGTEFGVKVDYDGTSDVHMFKGEASLMPGAAGRKDKGFPLVAGKANRVGPQGQVKEIKLNSKLFVKPRQYELMSKADKGSAYHRWLLYSNELCQDTTLVAYYTFEKDGKRPDILENKAAATQGRLNGNLLSASNAELPTWTTGRWPNKTALHFDRSNRQVVVVPSDPALHVNGPITIAAWVRCSKPEEGGHIVSCRKPDGTGNYQLGYNAPKASWEGRIQFGRMGEVNDELSDEDRIHSDRAYRESPEWRFIAATHDNQKVDFYMDGRHIETHDFYFQREPVNADLVIGADNADADPDRFTGEIGELMIFNRVLSNQEISEIHKNGQPL